MPSLSCTRAEKWRKMDKEHNKIGVTGKSSKFLSLCYATASVRAVTFLDFSARVQLSEGMCLCVRAVREKMHARTHAHFLLGRGVVGHGRKRRKENK